jgi:type II secretory pathway component PulL
VPRCDTFLHTSAENSESGASPIYYAAQCGFQASRNTSLSSVLNTRNRAPAAMCQHWPQHWRENTFNLDREVYLIVFTHMKRTKKDLLAHPLVTELQSCNSSSAILAVLQQQLQGLDQSRRIDDRWTRWLDPTVNVLFTLSATLGESVGLVCVRT